MKRNVGSIDRTFRVVIGLALIVLAATGSIGAWGYIGVIPLVTGLMGSCLLYRLLGIDTAATGGRT